MVTRVCQLRQQTNLSLAKIAEEILKECIDNGSRPSNDNLTLLIVDLAAYYQEYKKDAPESPVKAAFK